MQNWTEPFGVSAIGSSHKKNGRGCEDAYAYQISNDEKWIAICVSDGAGQAKYGGDAAKIVATEFAKKLIKIASQIDLKSPPIWINDSILQSVIEVRKILIDQADGDDLSEFSSTLLAILIGPIGGISIHIGDGTIIGGKFEIEGDNAFIDKEYFVSAPENQEYANQTYFITDQKWMKHLRIQALPKIDWLALMTDGGSAISLDRFLKPSQLFFKTLFKVILNEGSQNPEKLLEQLINNDIFEKKTSDDKTIVFLFSDKLANIKEKEILFSTQNIEPDNYIFDNFKNEDNNIELGTKSQEYQTIYDFVNEFININIPIYLILIFLTSALSIFLIAKILLDKILN